MGWMGRYGMGGDQNGGANVFKNPQRSSRIFSSFNNILYHKLFSTRLISLYSYERSVFS